MIRLYNTKSLTVEEFKPIHEGHVDMYVCGPTVYNYAHIGNARPMIVFDVLKRLFEAEGYTVKYVSNFTEVDDKIIKAANEEGVDSSVISERYIAECKKDMEGMIRGSLMLISFLQGVMPSRALASYKLSGIPCNAARRMSIL